jgi:hypothetical protein
MVRMRIFWGEALWEEGKGKRKRTGKRKGTGKKGLSPITRQSIYLQEIE